MPPMKAFAEQMTEFDARRKAARITDEELAEAAGTHASVISNYRKGRRQPLVDGWARLNSALDELIAQRTEDLRKLAL